MQLVDCQDGPAQGVEADGGSKLIRCDAEATEQIDSRADVAGRPVHVPDLVEPRGDALDPQQDLAGAEGRRDMLDEDGTGRRWRQKALDDRPA